MACERQITVTEHLRAVVVAPNQHIMYHALDALEHFGVSPRETVLIISASSQNHHDRVLAVASNHVWRQVCDVGLPSIMHPLRRTFAADLYRVQRTISFLHDLVRQEPDPLELFVSGFYGHPVDRTASTILRPRQSVLVDDGNMTREVARNRPGERAAGLRAAMRWNSTWDAVSLKGRIKIMLLRTIAGVQDRGDHCLVFYTHHRNLPVSAPDLVVAAGEQILDRPISEEVHLLGIPAVERSIVTATHYRTLLQWVAQRYKGWSITYHAHPAEGPDECRIASEAIPGVRIEPNQLPYEVRFRRNPNAPREVVAFYSSALANLAAIAPSDTKLVAIVIPGLMITDQVRRARVEQIYRDLQNIGRVSLITVQPAGIDAVIADSTPSDPAQVG